MRREKDLKKLKELIERKLKRITEDKEIEKNKKEKNE